MTISVIFFFDFSLQSFKLKSIVVVLASKKDGIWLKMVEELTNIVTTGGLRIFAARQLKDRQILEKFAMEVDGVAETSLMEDGMDSSLCSDDLNR